MATAQQPKQGAKKAGIFSVLALLFLKFKVAIFAAFKALSLFKVAWLFKSFGSMIISIGIYTMFFGWRYAVTIVALIFVHELGHFAWMKVKGLNPQAPMFVPMLGAYTAMTNLPPDLATHAWVAWAGPFVGGLAAFACYWFGLSTGNLFLVAAANTGAILNLLQLVPIKPFDGGFIAQSISRWLFIPGVVMLAFLAWHMHSILLIIIAGGSVFAMIAQARAGVDMSANRIPASPVQKFFISVAFIGLAASLAYLYWQSEIVAHAMMHK